MVGALVDRLALAGAFVVVFRHQREDGGQCIVDELRDQQARLDPVEGRPVRTGDYAIIAFTGTRDGVPFEGRSVTAAFLEQDGKFLIRTTGADGKPADFPVSHAFGIHPLQGRTDVAVDCAADIVDYRQVTDSGGGIPAEDLPRVFTRLYRADNVLIQGVGDTGVGLSIAKTLTEAQKGRIWVETKPGVGSTFSETTRASSARSGRPA